MDSFPFFVIEGSYLNLLSRASFNLHEFAHTPFAPIAVKSVSPCVALGGHVDENFFTPIAFQNADLGIRRNHLTAIDALNRIFFAKGQQAFSADCRVEQVDFLLLVFDGGGQAVYFATALRAYSCIACCHNPERPGKFRVPPSLLSLIRQFYHIWRNLLHSII